MPADNGYQYQTRTLQIAAGQRQEVDALDFFVLLSGSGLQVLTRGREGLPMDLPVRLVLGDGRSGRLGTLILYNPTGVAVAAQYVTSNRELTLTPLGSVQDVNVVSVTGTASQRVEGTEADGAAASARPVQTGGRDDGGNVQAHLVDTSGRALVVGAAAHDAAAAGAPVLAGAEARSTLAANVGDGDAVRVRADLTGRLVVAPHAPQELKSRGTLTLAATGIADVIAAPGAGRRLSVTQITVCNRDTAAATAILYDGAVEIGRVRVPIGDTRQLTFPEGLAIAANTALRADIEAAPATADVRVWASAGITG